jgi:hypothetical protein
MPAGGRGASNSVSRWAQFLRAVLAAATYRPERHYMRGNRQARGPAALQR